MGVTQGFAYRLPTCAGLWNRLIGTGFIGTPDRQPPRLSLPIRRLNPFFFASVSGSVTVTTMVCPAFFRGR